jgi:hypothetical protein
VADDEDRGGIDTAAPRGPREIHEREADAKKVPATWLAPFYLGTFFIQFGNAGGSAIGRAIL